MTALMFATQAGHIDVIKELISHEAEMQSSTGRLPLCLLSRLTVEKPSISLFLRKPVSKTILALRRSLSPLLSVFDIATRLFPYEKLIVRKDGSTALMTALQSDNTELVSLCMEEAGLKTEFEDTALNIALQLAFYNSAQLLMRSSKERELIGMTDLMVASFATTSRRSRSMLRHRK